jgi:hypothetical protein
MEIFVLWFVVWAAVQIVKSEPARSVILAIGILIAIGALVLHVHVAPLVVR